MSSPEARLTELGIILPAPISLPPKLHLPFTFVNVRGDRAFISGHPKQTMEGAIDGPYGQVGTDLNTEEAQLAARGIGLSVLANLKAEIGDLSRVAGWNRVFGMVNSAPGYDEQHIVINGFSDFIIDVFGPDVGRHSRSAIGVAGLPMNFAMEIEAELQLVDNI
ncbi:RidA family protein [Sneathiella marina]|uniref:RidA family protein n=1 Tax=Sneathiella marina TaxID=2950108 RepID=A0ABY4W7C7_9PROT|nr:RidA family protein [Sneathiella marina]USG62932.1 RidA family protein [Sneathiella marina]